MKPVLIQTLVRSMRNRIRLPDAPSADDVPKRKDRAGSIIISVFVLVVILCFLL